MHQRNQQGCTPTSPHPLYFADVILEHIVCVLILFRWLFLKIFYWNNQQLSEQQIINKPIKHTLLNLVVNFASITLIIRWTEQNIEKNICRDLLKDLFKCYISNFDLRPPPPPKSISSISNFCQTPHPPPMCWSNTWTLPKR